MVLDRTTAIAVALLAASTGLVTVRVASAPLPEPRPAATQADLARFADEIAGSERGWENETEQNFPSDRWSQRDDFHGREYKKVVELSKTNNVRIEEILRAVDADVRKAPVQSSEAPDLRDARAVPCKPRPFYD